MKKFLCCLSVFFLTSCALLSQDAPLEVQTQTQVLSLLSAYQNKDIVAFNKILSSDFPDKQSFQQNVLNAFLSRNNISMALLSLKVIPVLDRVLAKVVVDVSFSRSAGTRDGQRFLSMEKSGVLTFCRQKNSLKLCNVSSDGLFF